MRLIDLFEDAESDRIARAEAAAVYDAVLAALRAADEASFSHHKFAGGSFIFRSDVLPDELLLFLIDKEQMSFFGEAKMGSLIKKPMIAMAVLNEPGKLDGAVENFAAIRRDFYHEYNHYLLRKKSGHLGRSGEAAMNNDSRGYYNDPDEANAFFQEAAGEFERDMREAQRRIEEPDVRAFLRRLGAFPDQMLVRFFMDRYLDKNFVDWLDAKRKRALQKRAAMFVRETIKPMIADMT